MKNLFYLLSFIGVLIFAGSCQQLSSNDLVIPDERKEVGADNLLSIPSYFLRSTNSSNGLVTMDFKVICESGLLETDNMYGVIFYSNKCRSIKSIGIEYTKNGNALCLDKEKVYYIIPSIGPVNKSTLKIKLLNTFKPVTLFQYNVDTGLFSIVGNGTVPTITWSNINAEIADCL